MKDRISIVPPCGPLLGHAADGVGAWKGIPFALPPLGERRFRPPEPMPRWAEPRDATRYGASSIFSPLPGGASEGPLIGDEDCLTLNVWAPIDPDAAPRPVLVWVHGGGFVRGSGSGHDGGQLARRHDLVVVTINYRLGPWGFLHLADRLPGHAGSSNLALRDILAALRWVRENIAAFGGDPDRVTLCGESAGAMLIGCLLGAPGIHGLFHRAVLLSGGAYNVRDRDTANAITDAFLRALDLDAARAGEVLTLPGARLRDAAAAVQRLSITEPWDAEAFLPVHGDDLLPEHPMAAIAAGSAAGIPLLISTMRDEMNLFAATQPGLMAGKWRFGLAMAGEREWEAIADGYARSPGSDQADSRTRMLGAMMFGVPALRLAQAQHAAGGRCWTMRIDHRLSFPPFAQWGPCHVADVLLLWEGFDFGGRSLAALGDQGDREMAEGFRGTVAAFARDAVPAHPGLGGWPPFEDEGSPSLLLRLNAALGASMAEAERALWRAARYFGDGRWPGA